MTRILAVPLFSVLVVLSFGCQTRTWPPEVVDPPSSPVLSPEEGLESIVVPPPFRVELVAAEPLVEDPVAMDIDPDGRLWVVEMRAWMTDIDGSGGLRPTGKIVVLDDTTADGRMDTRTVFMDSLVTPNGVLVLSDGVLVSEPNFLWMVRDVDGDLVADEKVVVSDRFGMRRANAEWNANGLVWGMDNWVHTTNHDRRYRWKDGEWMEDSTIPVGQFGVAMDDYGRMYRNDNTRPVFVDYVQPYYYARNPNLPRPSGIQEPIAENREVWPVRTTPGANRGYQETTLRDDGTLQTFTAACGPALYRGGGYPADFSDEINLFVAEPVGNLVHRYVVQDQPDGTRTATPAYERGSFVASTDERFRPVNTYWGPEGALYVVDMYRGIVQHRDFQTTYLRNHIQANELAQPIGLGRIYRIVHEQTSAFSRPALSGKPADELVAYLHHLNGWWRDRAQRLLVERGDTTVVRSLLEIVGSSDPVVDRLHALWTLEGLDAMSSELVHTVLGDRSPRIRSTAVRLSEPWLRDGDEATEAAVSSLVNDPDPAVRLQVAASLGEGNVSKLSPMLATLLTAHAGQPFMAATVISSLHGEEMSFLTRLLHEPAWRDSSKAFGTTLGLLATAVVKSGRPDEIDRLFDAAANESLPKWHRLSLLNGVEALVPSHRGVQLPLELPRSPRSLERLLATGDSTVASTAQRIASRLVWPGKPGVRNRLDQMLPDVRARFERGREVYAMRCAQCHGEDGQGQEGVAKPLAGSEWVHGPHYNLVRILLHGKEGSTGLMPPQRDLSDEEIAQVLTYIRNAWGNAAYPVTSDQASDVRMETALREEPWRDAELEATLH